MDDDMAYNDGWHAYMAGHPLRFEGSWQAQMDRLMAWERGWRDAAQADMERARSNTPSEYEMYRSDE